MSQFVDTNLDPRQAASGGAALATHTHIFTGFATTTPAYIASHTVLIIDKSGSMRNEDAQGADGVSVRRNDALFDCLLGQFLPDQKKADRGPGDVYSMILFRSEGSLLFKHKPIIEAEDFVKRAKVASPRYHGHYCNALLTLGSLLTETLSATALCTTILFMSDGMPSDGFITHDGKQKEIKARDKLAKVTNHVLEHLQTALEPCLSALAGKSTLSFHTLGFGPAGDFLVLKAMAESVPHGTFHLSGLSTLELQKTISTLSTSIIESRLSSSSKQVGPARPLRDVTIQTGSAYITYLNVTAWDPPLTLAGNKWMFKGEFDIRVSTTVFGQGSERNAFTMKFLRGNKEMVQNEWVAKEEKHLSDLLEEAEFHKQKLLSQIYSKAMAERFNNCLRSLVTTTSLHYYNMFQVRFQPCFLCVTKDKSRKFFVEELVKGQWLKWNNNSGEISAAISKGARSPGAIYDRLTGDLIPGPHAAADDVPQAFSHWSFIHSKDILGQRLLICDLQGFYSAEKSSFTMIDPAIHSPNREGAYARTDHGTKGIAKFFGTHQCNDLCKALKLPRVKYTGPPLTDGASDPAPTGMGLSSVSSIKTSEIIVEKTNHLQQRQVERDIATKELKRAVKHGEKVPGRQGSIKHYDKDTGVEYITDALGKVGITSYRK